MRPTLKILLALVIWIVGFAATVGIGQYGTDNYFLPFALASMIFCFAYWLGGRFFEEGWVEDSNDLGKPLIDHLRYSSGSAAMCWVQTAGWCSASLFAHIFKNGGAFIWEDFWPTAIFAWPGLAFVMYTNPWRRISRRPTAGFAIHERGIRTDDKYIKFAEIQSIDPQLVAPGTFRIKLENETIFCGSTDLSEQQIKAALALLEERRLLHESFVDGEQTAVGTLSV